jgi:hypothetical protein
LAPKFEANKPSVPQQAPHDRFGLGRLAAHAARILSKRGTHRTMT